ncbi:MAG: polyprenol monophosphomannose synthase [Candidatus Aminicenantales bacterium]
MPGPDPCEGGERNSRMKVTVVIPTFNEADNLAAMAGALLALPVPALSLLVVDDESPDGTGRLADDLADSSAGRVDVLHRHGVRGLGLAYRDGFLRALERGADALVQMDADFSHAPADVPRLLERLADCDVAVGSRYVPGGGVDDKWGFGRFALSRSANAYARTFLGLRTRDATAGFKAWRRSALESVGPGRVRSNGYLFQVEMAYISERLGLRICEVPILFTERRAGASKMSLRVKTEAALGLFRVWCSHHRLRPVA